MSPRTPDQYQKIRQDKRQLIEDTALELFASKGFHATSISDIATQAGISKGLMYNYFESKESLLHAIIDDSIDEMMAAFDPNNDGVLTEEEFIFLVNEMFRILSEKTKTWKFLLSLFMQPVVMSLYEEKMMALMPKLLQTTMTYFASKGYDDPQTEAIYLGSLLDGIAFDYVMAPEIYPLDKIKNRLLTMYTK